MIAVITQQMHICFYGAGGVNLDYLHVIFRAFRNMRLCSTVDQLETIQSRNDYRRFSYFNEALINFNRRVSVYFIFFNMLEIKLDFIIPALTIRFQKVTR